MTKNKRVNPEEYDEEYFERGISSGKSGYQDYHWMPERTIKFAHKIIKELNLREGDKILDYGCAKGFVTKAFRILDIDAWGCDISKYAIDNVDKEVKEYCSLMEDGKIPYNFKFKWIVAKDVFEHLSENQLEKVLRDAKEKAENIFVVVPLGDGKKYIVPQYEDDVTHVLREPREWWENKFESENWKVDRFSYLVNGMKDNWAHYEKGNGFFFLSKNNPLSK
ncbi:class I SAM-dependent methyltransferase [archaeon]|nr:class I SAM-dependent methyltransferase [archaeon]